MIIIFSCVMVRRPPTSSFFFFNDTATTEIYTLSLHDALPIFHELRPLRTSFPESGVLLPQSWERATGDRKSTRLNSSHQIISYAVFCLKKKKPHRPTRRVRARMQCPPIRRRP